jgi:hypothetical protein
MNDEQPPPQLHTPVYSQWQRFVNWLAGGPPDPEKIAASRKKYPTWYRRYRLTLFMLIGSYVVLIHPHIITRLNAEPELDRMQTLSVRILKTRELHPHFDMQLPDGSVQAMEWLVKLTISRGKRVFYWTKAQRQALVGCQATIQMAPIRWTITDRYRVWALSCPSIGFEVSVEQTAGELRALATSVKELLISCLILFFPFWIVFFLREKRGVL